MMRRALLRHGGVVLALLGATVALYAPFLGNPLVFDDKLFFSGRLFAHYATHPLGLDLRLPAYFSLTMTEVVWGGVVAQRTVSLFLHAACVLLLYRLLVNAQRSALPGAPETDVVARAAGAPLGDIERLNPEYVRGMTPPGRESLLRVPEGQGPAFEVAYAAIPPEERVSFVEHRVADGETLSHIALRYGIRVADLEAANPGIRARYLRVGRILTVPVAPSARRTARASAADS